MDKKEKQRSVRQERPFIVGGIIVIASAGSSASQTSHQCCEQRTKEVSGNTRCRMYLPFGSRVQRLFVNVVHLANGVSVHGGWLLAEKME
jgi:hypothetical protein